MRLSNSKVKTYRRCPKQFEFKYVEGLRSKRKSLPLYRGDWLHQLIMHHYDGEDWQTHHEALALEFFKLFEEEREELGDLPAECERIMTSYIAHWAREDEGLHIVDSELNEIVPLPNGDEFNFIIDLVVEESDGGLWLWDHKTVKSFMPADFTLMDAQLARYFWAAEAMGYKPLRGVMFNEIITKPPTPPEMLKSGRLTERQNLQCDVYTYLATVRAYGLQPQDYRDTLLRLKSQSDRWYRRSRLPRDRGLVKVTMDEMMWTADEMRTAHDTGRYPRSVQKDCAWSCDFLEPCMIQMMGGDIRDVVKLRYERKPPKEEL